MKKIIIFSLLLFFPMYSYSWFCVGWEYYKIISYNDSATYSIKWDWLYDLFLSGPLGSSKNILWNDSHHTWKTMQICKYEGFEDIKNLKYSDLLWEDKKVFIVNLLFSLFILFSIISILYRYYKKCNWKKYKSFQLYK